MGTKERYLLVIFLLVTSDGLNVQSDSISYNTEIKGGDQPKEHLVLLILDMEKPQENLSEIKYILKGVSEINNNLYFKFPGHPFVHVDSSSDIERLLPGNEIRLTEEELAESLKQCERGTRVYIISDHHLEEGTHFEELLDTIMMKQLEIHFLDNNDYETGGSRRRRQATSSCGTNVYQCIAQQSGGTVITTHKDQMGSVTNLLKQSLKPQTVNIKRFTFAKPMMSKFKFPVDNTMSEISVLIRTVNETKAPLALMYLPTGLPAARNAQNLGMNMLLLESNITQASQYGLWQIQKLDMNTWDVTVTAQSPVDFTYQFLEPGPGGYGEYPIQGRPLAGRTVKLMVTVPQYEKVTGVSTSFFEDEFYNVFDVMNMQNVGGRRRKSMFYTSIAVPSKMFRIAIQGVNKSGHQFRRLQLAYIIPVSFKLFVPSLTGVKLYTNETLRIPFTVENIGSKKQDVDVEISDDKLFAQMPVRVSATIDPGTNFTGNFTLLGGTKIGATTTLTITAKPYVRGHITNGQFDIRRLTVEKRGKVSKDPYPPTCRVTKVTGTCDIGSDLCQCVNERWSMEVEIGDVGLGLRDVFPTSVGSTYNFTVTPFPTAGYNTSVGTVMAILEDDCCHQTASISAVDIQGNTTYCVSNITRNFKPPNLAICNSTVQSNLTVTAKSIKTMGSCNQIFPCDCHNKTWRMQVEFDKINGNNLYQAFTIGAGHNSTMTYINLQTIEVEADCCHRDVALAATDVAGNIGLVNVTMTNYTYCTPTTISHPATRAFWTGIIGPKSSAANIYPSASSHKPFSSNTSVINNLTNSTAMPVMSSSLAALPNSTVTSTLPTKSTISSAPTTKQLASSSTVTSRPKNPATAGTSVVPVNQGLPAKLVPCFNGSMLDLQIKIQMSLLNKGSNP